jgi:Alkylmercury lyase
VDGLELDVRNHVYQRFVELGRAPRFDEIAADLALPFDTVSDVLERLHDAHALVLERDRKRIRMANPFSAVATPHRVHARGRWWYANCAWDAFGVVAALHEDGHIASSCADCGEPIELDVRDGEVDTDGHVVHINVPAAHWWDDIVFT